MFKPETPLASDPFLSRELARFDAEAPIHAALTPPSTWYVDPRFLAAERDAAFFASWQPVARSDQLRDPGDCAAGEFLGKPWVIVRGKDGGLKGFYNVCAHHAAEVAPQGASRCTELVCPYHGWTYDLSGRLARAPGLGKQDGFDVGGYGLRPIAVEEWGPLVFVSFAEAAGSLSRDLAPLKSRLDEMGMDLRFVARRDYVIRCNWKVFVDNYLDGGYHVAAVHPGLAGQLDMDGYRTEVFEKFSIQSCGAAGRKSDDARHDKNTPAGNGAGDFAERIGRGSIYAWLYPNLMINRYGPMMDANWVIPLSPDSTRTIFDYYFEGPYLDAMTRREGEPAAKDFIHRSLAASHQVQVEDIGVCESVQRGLTSGVFHGGRYASTERGEFHFHSLLWNDLRAFSIRS